MNARGSALTAPARVQAIDRTGLGSRADAVLDGYCSAVQQALNVPVALVSLVRPAHQEFPGQAGLPPEVAAARRTPLTYSFCQHVVLRGGVLVISDTARSPRLAEAVVLTGELPIGSYAGVPLTDEQGLVLGALCVLDHVARNWTAEELRVLRTYGEIISADLQRRIDPDSASDQDE